MSMTLEALAARVAERAAASPDESYTAKLLGAGVPRCAKKFGEESTELIIAAMGGEKGEVKAEAADVLYHFLVLLRAADVGFGDVMAELDRRTARSGLAEKAARKDRRP